MGTEANTNFHDGLRSVCIYRKVLKMERILMENGEML